MQLKNEKKATKKVKERLKIFVADHLLNDRKDALFDGLLCEAVIDGVTELYYTKVFDAFSLLKEMDLSNHVLSMRAIGLLRKMVSRWRANKRKDINLFPLPTALSQMGKIIAKRGRLAVPYTANKLPEKFGGG